MNMFTRIDKLEAFSYLQSGATLVTSTRRLSRNIQNQYAADRASSGVRAWETPDVLPLFSWVDRSLLQIQQDKQVSAGSKQQLFLEEMQELVLWERIIRKSQAGKGLLNLQQTARSAKQARALCLDWGISIQELQKFAHPDARAFLQWVEEFAEICRKNNWTETSARPLQLIESLANGQFNPPKWLILAGFDEFTPQQVKLFQALQGNGCIILEEFSPRKSKKQIRMTFRSKEEELECASNWAGSLLQHNPQLKIGLVVPDLQSRRDQIMQVLARELSPHAGLDSGLAQEQIFHISLGKSLMEYPLVADAVNALSFARGLIFWEDLSLFLRSAYFGGSVSEYCARARLDAYLRGQGNSRIGRKRLLQEIERQPDNSLVVLGDNLKRYFQFWQELPSRQGPADWAGCFAEALQILGWPGERTLNSQEYQIINSWSEALSSFCRLELMLGAIDLSQALSWLKNCLGVAVFQPMQKQAPIQVMGALEAGGEDFDHLWVLSLTDDIWPSPPKPNPFIPLQLQRKHHLPHCNADRELAYCKTITNRILDSAEEIIISYPCMEGEREMFASPLILHLPLVQRKEQISDLPGPVWKRLPQVKLEHYQEEFGPCLESLRVKGGTGMIKAQSNCPFQAFARFRLQAEKLHEPSIGLDALDRGNLVHLALKSFWKDMREQTALLEQEKHVVQEKISKAVDEALDYFSRQKPETMHETFLDLERHRLLDLLSEWLEVEKTRPYFRVQELERRWDLHLAGIDLQVYVDRVDILENQELLIIDYKTGEHSVSEWFEDRLSEPQLPMYCLARQHKAGGIYFAQLRKGETKFIGLGRSAAFIPKTYAVEDCKYAQGLKTWQAVKAYWQERLEDIAREFKQGLALVKPKDRDLVCGRCDLACFCRIAEAEYAQQSG